jgi:uncharacterized protein YndB with AHSA1/START domain
MVADSIEREVLIDAPPEVVWSIVTKPEHIAGWFSESAQVDLRPGGELVLSWERLGTVTAVVEEVQRPRVFSFRWVSPEPDRDAELREGYYTLVAFMLQPEGDGTLLRVVESGFAHIDGTEAYNAQLAERHRNGWGTFLGRLAEYASRTGVPVPR